MTSTAFVEITDAVVDFSIDTIACHPVSAAAQLSTAELLDASSRRSCRRQSAWHLDFWPQPRSVAAHGPPMAKPHDN